MLQSLSSLSFVIAIVLSTFALGSNVNQTIDDLSPFILYQPPEKWHTYNDASCSGGTYTIGHDSCVNATIQCSWVSFYYSSPLWPYGISTEISIDGNEPTVVDLQDHSVPSDNTALSPSTNSRVVFSYVGTQSLLHTILISGSAANPYSVVDSLIFETVDGYGCGGGYGYHGGSTYSYSYNDISTTTDTVTATTTTTTTTKIDAPLTEISTSISTKTVGTLTTTKTTTTTEFGATKSADTNVVTYYRHRNHGLKIGIAILAVVVGCLILCLCYLLWHRRRHHAAYIPPGEKPGYGYGGEGGGNAGGNYGAGYGGGGGEPPAPAPATGYGAGTAAGENAS